MLGKLLKYEFKSTARIMLPLYLLLVVMAFVNGVSLKISLMGDNRKNFGLEGIILFAFFAVVVAIMVITLYNIITRFYKNLLGKEGYLMFTLPSKPTSLVASKALVGTLWSLASLLVIVVCTGIMGLITVNSPMSDIFGKFADKLNRLSLEYDINIYLTSIMYFLAYVALILKGLMTIYLSMALGHLRNSGRIMASIASYIGITMVLQFIYYIFTLIIGKIDDNTIMGILNNIQFNTGVLYVMGVILIYSLLISFIFFKLVCFILEKRLNLE